MSISPDSPEWSALETIVQRLAKHSAKLAYYGSSLGAIVLLGGKQLPPEVEAVASTIGAGILTNLIEKVAKGDDVSDDEIQSGVQYAVSDTKIDTLLTKQDFLQGYARLIKRLDEQNEVSQVVLNEIRDGFDKVATAEQVAELHSLILSLKDAVPEGIQAEHKDPIFISYARADGREIASDLRKDLMARGFNVWQDVVAMEGGDKWWQQIKDAIEGSRVMVLVLTNGALASGTVHDEWTHARTAGTHIMPVTMDDEIFAKAPRWIQKVDVFILNPSHADYEMTHTRYLKQFNDPPKRAPRPFTVPNIPEHFVKRPREMNAMVKHLLDENQQNPVAITTALQGGGGFGKTTLAIALCHDEQVRVAFDDGILWLQFREQMTANDVLGLLNEQIQLLAPQNNLYSELNSASAQFRELLKDRDILIVLDDVWTESYLQYCIHEETAYIITTRLQAVVGRARAERINVDDMQTDEAKNLLVKWLPEPPMDSEKTLLNDLAQRLGEWALLLEMVGVELRNLMDEDLTLAQAIDHVVIRLDEQGMGYLNRDDEAQRNLSISLSIDASISRLKGEYTQRLYELAIFPEDIDIPFDTIAQLWDATIGYKSTQTEDALLAINRLSLFTRYSANQQIIRLHDVIRKILAERLSDSKTAHHQLINHWGKSGLDKLPDNYAWLNIAYHLLGAKREAELQELLLDFQFIQTKLNATNPNALLADFEMIDDNSLRLVKSAISMSAHVIGKEKNALALYLYGRLMGHKTQHPELANLLVTAEARQEAIQIIYPSLSQAGDTLIRSIRLPGEAKALALTKDGKYILIAVERHILVYEWRSGAMISDFIQSGWVNSLSVQGDIVILTARWKQSEIKVWNWRTGELVTNFTEHSRTVTSVILQGELAFSASLDTTVKVWNWRSGELVTELTGAVSIDQLHVRGDIAITSSQTKVFVHNWKTGDFIASFSQHTRNVTKVVLAHSFALSASYDGTVKVWNWRSGELLTNFTEHADGVNSVSVQGDVALSASSDGTVKVWNWRSGELLKNFTKHTNSVNDVSAQSEVAFSVSDDRTIKVWNWQTSDLKTTVSADLGTLKSLQGEIAAFTLHNNIIAIWNWRTNEVVNEFRHHTDRIWNVSLQGDFAFSTSSDNTIKVWNWTSGEIITEHHEPATSLSVQDDLIFYSISTIDNLLKIWNWRSGDLDAQFHAESFILDLSIQGDLAVGAMSNETVSAWNWRSGEWLTDFTEHTGAIHSVSVQGDVAFSASNDATVKVWNCRSGELITDFTEHTDTVSSIIVQGNLAFSASFDHTVKIWNWLNGEVLATFAADAPLYRVAIEPEHRILLTADTLGRVHVLRLVGLDHFLHLEKD